MPCLSFVAPSGTGKTTLLSKVVTSLTERGLRCAVLKATHHRIQLDVPGKDSYRFADAGALSVGVVGPGTATLFLDPRAREEGGRPSALEIADWLGKSPYGAPDLVLCEGFFSEGGLPKLRVCRGPLPKGTLGEEHPEDIIALAWDGDLSLARDRADAQGFAVLPLDGVAVADWIESFIRDHSHAGEAE